MATHEIDIVHLFWWGLMLTVPSWVRLIMCNLEWNLFSSIVHVSNWSNWRWNVTVHYDDVTCSLRLIWGDNSRLSTRNMPIIVMWLTNRWGKAQFKIVNQMRGKEEGTMSDWFNFKDLAYVYTGDNHVRRIWCLTNVTYDIEACVTHVCNAR